MTALPHDDVPPTPQLEYALTVSLELGDAYTTPTMGSGVRHGQVGIVSGEFRGPRLAGRVLPSGGDSPAVRRDGVATLDARYFLEEEDGTLIRIHNRGVFRMDPAVWERIARGEEVGPEEYYIRTSPVFEVPEGPHDWLARHTFVGIGSRHTTGNRIDYFRVL